MGLLNSLFYGCALGVVLAPANAFASAWRATTDGQEIGTATAGYSDDAAFYDYDIYWEIPASRHISFIVAPSIENSVVPATDGSGGVINSARAETSLAVKGVVRERAHTTLALQTGLTWTTASESACDEVGGEARALAGASAGKFFGDLEIAYRARSGGCRDGKIDLTAGWRPSERWMGLAQVFIDDAKGASSPAVKLQMSLVRFNDEGAGLQVGFRVRTDPDGAGERALVVGWWRAPHKTVTP